MISGLLIIIIGLAILGSFLCMAIINRRTFKISFKLISTSLVVITIILMYQGLHMIYGWSAPQEKLPEGKAVMVSYYADERNDKIYVWLISPEYEYDYVLPEIIELINHRQPRGIYVQYNKELHDQLEKLRQMSGGQPIKIEIKTIEGLKTVEPGEITEGGDIKQYVLPDVDIMEK